MSAEREVWLVELREGTVPSEVYSTVAVCSSRKAAIKWIRDFGVQNAEQASDFYAVEPAIVDGGTDSVPMSDGYPKFYTTSGKQLKI